ncbi:hypothetical protein [Cytobacillus praedii]|uniref:hypothetical protein n=1 Tax=Cytobacillus praedii TaxID=1742358 RepID=UPI002E232103|nr:hypothetical protein [Cytobacillus praedii]
MDNVSFIEGNTINGFLFKPNEFDCAYIIKGPTSAYPYLKKVIKNGGMILGLHPGDQWGKELPILFPNLFNCSKGTPILDTIKHRLKNSNYSCHHIDVIKSLEFISSPIDVLKLRCFGQHPSIYEILKEKYLFEIAKIFKQNATADGLPITFSSYLVRAIV